MTHNSLLNLLRGRFAAAIAKLAGDDPSSVDPQLRAAGEPRFGDYQCNAAMALAKLLGAKPRDVAQQIVAAVDLAEDGVSVVEPLEIAGPGFINIRLSNAFLGRYLCEIPAPPAASPTAPPTADGAAPDRSEQRGALRTGWQASLADRLGMPPVSRPQRIVLDYSSPNIAKQMHVGHLRGTILGDCLARTLEFVGHTVIRQNHVGDWGTQFGKLIAWYTEHPVPAGDDSDAVLDAIEADYRAANKRFDADPAFAAAARQAVGRLQGGDAAAREIWQRLYAQSQRAFNEVYARLGATLTDADIRGESFYNDRLAATVDELRRRFSPRGGAEAQTGPRMEVREDQGALCVFLYDTTGQPCFRNAEGGEFPIMIQKSDGAFLYASTDLAAVRYRVQELKADRVIYVIGNEQSRHLQMLFMAARLAGWAPERVRLEHAGHGLVLGPDGKKLTGRHGGSVHLRALLDEAVERARALMEEIDRRREGDETAATLDDEERRRVAACVGIGAVKYADLSHDRNTDYRFDWDKLLALKGNTAPYMLYAYARIRSIYRRAAERAGTIEPYGREAALELGEPAERALALRLARFRETIEVVAADLTPNVLCGYLYELAGDFMRFYEACPVLAAPDESTRLARMRMCDLSARTLKLGLGLLGIETVERM
ncbi:MAG: arginine--tRNA ligase [Phycisphaerae bacterium]|jgi:arginyl-tRNA synthetase